MIAVFQVTNKCNLSCPHCFFNSGPEKKNNLPLTKAVSGIKDLERSKLKINEFLITGGEPILWINKTALYQKNTQKNPLFKNSNTKKIIELIKEKFPSSKIRLDTNGILFYEYPALFDFYKPSSFQLSIDLMHKTGASKKGSNLVLLSNGKSELLELFIKMKKKFHFDIYVRWTSNRKDKPIFERFKKRYAPRGIVITQKLVTKTGRAQKMPIQETGKGFLIEENPDNFKCLFGGAIILSLNGWWYGCYHPCKLTKLTRPGNKRFKDKLRSLHKNKSIRILKNNGIFNYLKYVERTYPQSKKEVSAILKKKYWYRCEPCLEAQKKKILS